MIALLAGCQSDDESHSHTFAESWTFDGTKHWHAADCGHDEKKDEAEHTFNDGVITTPATETTEGVKTFTCTVCGYKKTESIPVLGHTHTFADTWSFDETKHWHKATCKHSDEKGGYAEHTFNDGEIITLATEEKNGEKTLTCTVCGYVKTEAVAKLPHTFDTENWENDATHHWHKATCEHSDEKGDYAEHVFGDWTVKTPADYGMPKVEEKTCTVCSYYEERTGDYTGDFYMIVSERFVVNGNIVIAGTVSRGSINTGDKIAISGYDEELTALELYKGGGRTRSESLGYGDGEISIHLGTVANSDNIKGRAVVSKSGTMQTYNKFSANIYKFHKNEGGQHTPIYTNNKIELYIGDVSVVLGTITLPEGVEMVKSEETCTITITLDKEIPLYEGLGIGGKTVGGSVKLFRGTVMSLLNE